MIATLPQLSCTRKGEDDPLLSLRTRKNRLCGKWKITEGRTRMDYSAAFLGPVYSSYNGAVETIFSPHSNQALDTLEYTLEVEFNKDNTFSWTMNWSRSIGVNEKGVLKGQWDFLSKSDQQKNKFEIILTPEENNSNWLFSYSCPFPVSQHNTVFELRELRKNKIVIRREFNISTENLSNPFSGQTSPYYEEWILEPR